MRGIRFMLAALVLGTNSLAVALDVSAKSAIIIDAGSGKVLWTKNAQAAMYPASTTKIMTGLLLIEHCRPDEVITAPPDILSVKESSMHLKPGEKVTAHDMLYALMLRSANDGAYAVATHISGSVSEFAKLMNERARQVGCTNTHFHNPNGLNDIEHTTCAHDLALIARAAMKYPAFREVVKTYKYEINRSINEKDRWMVNHDKLLRKDPSADGVKTGYTVPAGHCFVGSATRDGFRVITVVLKSNHWQLDDQALTDWAFKQFEKKQTIPAGTVVGSVEIPGGGSKPVPVSLAEDAYTVGQKGTIPTQPLMTVEPAKTLRAPIKTGDRVGFLALTDADGWLQRIPVVADADSAEAVPRKVAQSPTASTFFFGGALFLGAVIVRERAKRKMRINGRTTTKRSF